MKATHPGSQGNPGLPNIPCVCRPELGNPTQSHRQCFVRLLSEGMVGRDGGWVALGPLHPEEGSSPGSSQRERRNVARPWVLPGHPHVLQALVTGLPHGGGERVPGVQTQAGSVGCRGKSPQKQQAVWDSDDLADLRVSSRSRKLHCSTGRTPGPLRHRPPQKHHLAQAWGRGFPRCPAVRVEGRWGPNRDSVQNVRLEGDQVVIG